MALAINNPPTNSLHIVNACARCYVLVLASDHSFFAAIGKDPPFPLHAYCLSGIGKSLPVD